MNVTYLHHRARDLVGIVPDFLSESDPRPAAEQFNERYAHGGGWSPMTGWEFTPETGWLKYPGDPAHRPITKMVLHKDKDRPETIYVYEHAWIAIVQADGTYEVARMD